VLILQIEDLCRLKSSAKEKVWRQRELYKSERAINYRQAFRTLKRTGTQLYYYSASSRFTHNNTRPPTTRIHQQR